MLADVRQANAALLRQLNQGAKLSRAWTDEGDLGVRGRIWADGSAHIRLRADIEMPNGQQGSFELVADLIGAEPATAELSGIALDHATVVLTPTVDALTVLVSWPSHQSQPYIAFSAQGNFGHWEVTV